MSVKKIENQQVTLPNHYHVQDKLQGYLVQLFTVANIDFVHTSALSYLVLVP